MNNHENTVNLLRRLVQTGLVLSLATLSACASASSGASPSSAAAPVPTPAGLESLPAVVATPYSIQVAHQDSIRRPYTKADIEFMEGMIHHHSQAVKMSGWASTHGANESVQRLASRIILGQMTEINLMQQWLADRRQPVPTPDPNGMKMKMEGMGDMEHTMLMPGMLTDEQMKQLDAARGRDFDMLYLRYMIQHHSGAISMVEKLLATDGAAQDEFTYKFSAEVQAGQTTEIDRMQQMLDALTAGRS
jgi:uncharacterized protein (DUF305 family)